MNIDILTIVTILVVSICSFGYLLAIMLVDWRASEKTKGALFSNFEKRFRDQRKPGPDCFQSCMKKFAWDVEEVPLCASKCKT
jgi:hypothetical protein